MALNHYLLLGIPPDADQQRIRAAYRSLAKRFHPDANRGSETATELFCQINEAYRVLADPATRREYDRKRRAEQAVVGQPRRPAKERAANGAAEDKFNRFLNTLLDELFGTLKQPPPRTAEGKRTSPKRAAPLKKRRRPAFSFYFHLALEKQCAPYELGKDGIYRSPEKARKTTGHRSGFGRMPRGCVLLALLTALLSLLKP